jgi:hypothetical protein
MIHLRALTPDRGNGAFCFNQFSAQGFYAA